MLQYPAVELATNFRSAMTGWNIATSNWLRRCVYERAPKGFELMFAFGCVPSLASQSTAAVVVLTAAVVVLGSGVMMGLTLCGGGACATDGLLAVAHVALAQLALSHTDALAHRLRGS
eukprot:3430374-Rhodomonas_salina.1